MSENCTYCWIVSRNACSEYRGRARVLELQSCPNLDPEQQAYHASTCEAATPADRELAEYRRKYGRL